MYNKLCSALLSFYSPSMMEAHNSHQRHEPPSVLHASSGSSKSTTPLQPRFSRGRRKKPAN
jgi:hypothetical protein